jgi:hypothetical protein
MSSVGVDIGGLRIFLQPRPKRVAGEPLPKVPFARKLLTMHDRRPTISPASFAASSYMN